MNDRQTKVEGFKAKRPLLSNGTPIQVGPYHRNRRSPRRKVPTLLPYISFRASGLLLTGFTGLLGVWDPYVVLRSYAGVQWFLGSTYGDIYEV